MEEEIRAHSCTTEELHMPNGAVFASSADFFKVFGDETRMKILYALSKSELCVNHISEALGMSVSAVSHHLRLLKQMRIVRNRRDGKTIYYELADDHILKMIDLAFEHINEEQGGQQ